MEASKHIAVLDKAIQIIEFMLDYPYGISLHKIAEGVSLNKSTVYRILSTLKDFQYITQNPDNNNYKLGSRFIVIASIFDHTEIRQIAIPHMQRLTNESSYSSSLALLDEYDSLTIDRIPAPKSSVLKIEATIGFKIPLHCCGSGKAIMTGFSDQKFEEYLRKVPLTAITVHTVTNPLFLKQQITLARQRGFAIEDAETEENIVTISAPIKNSKCETIAAISVMNVKQVFNEEKIAEVGSMLKGYADAISMELGCPSDHL